MSSLRSGPPALVLSHLSCDLQTESLYRPEFRDSRSRCWSFGTGSIQIPQNASAAPWVELPAPCQLQPPSILQRPRAYYPCRPAAWKEAWLLEERKGVSERGWRIERVKQEERKGREGNLTFLGWFSGAIGSLDRNGTLVYDSRGIVLPSEINGTFNSRPLFLRWTFRCCFLSCFQYMIIFGYKIRSQSFSLIVSSFIPVHGWIVGRSINRKEEKGREAMLLWWGIWRDDGL